MSQVKLILSHNMLGLVIDHNFYLNSGPLSGTLKIRLCIRVATSTETMVQGTARMCFSTACQLYTYADNTCRPLDEPLRRPPGLAETLVAFRAYGNRVCARLGSKSEVVMRLGGFILAWPFMAFLHLVLRPTCAKLQPTFFTLPLGSEEEIEEGDWCSSAVDPLHEEHWQMQRGHVVLNVAAYTPNRRDLEAAETFTALRILVQEM